MFLHQGLEEFIKDEMSSEHQIFFSSLSLLENLEIKERNFFEYLPEHKEDHKTIKNRPQRLFDQAIKKIFQKNKFPIN